MTKRADKQLPKREKYLREKEQQKKGTMQRITRKKLLRLLFLGICGFFILLTLFLPDDKKLLGILTALCYDKDVVHAEYQDAVAYISSIGIINLENGYFEPDKPVGEVEAVSILERLFEELLDAQDDLLWYVGDNAVEIKGNAWFVLQ